jgi:hypothetical protein
MRGSPPPGAFSHASMLVRQYLAKGIEIPGYSEAKLKAAGSLRSTGASSLPSAPCTTALATLSWHATTSARASSERIAPRHELSVGFGAKPAKQLATRSIPRCARLEWAGCAYEVRHPVCWHA